MYNAYQYYYFMLSLFKNDEVATVMCATEITFKVRCVALSVVRIMGFLDKGNAPLKALKRKRQQQFSP